MPDEPTTGDLVRRALAGDGRAFALLAERHLRAAYATALAVIGNPADAEDVAQEALLVAFERLESCRDPERFSGWLLEIARNRARNDRDKVRVRHRHAESAKVVPAEPAVQQHLGGLRDSLLRALATLTEMQREIVLLHDLDGWTHAELAALLRISEVSSRQHLFNARRALRTRLADDPSKEAHRG